MTTIADRMQPRRGLANLRKYLGKVRRDFDVESLLRDPVDEKTVIDYYVGSELGYRFIHSKEGAIHMALKFDGRFDETGYYGQPAIVEEYLHQNHGQRVLELASGKGFNSLYLANRNASVQFDGIDLNRMHVQVAQKRAASVPNVAFSVGNFEDLRFEDQTFDLVFVVESLCHASDPARALSEAYRVLRPGGLLVIFDGFRTESFDSLDPEVRLAARLVERSMAVDRGRTIAEWVTFARDAGFTVSRNQDISRAIMPNLERFQFLARGFFKYPRLSRLISGLLPGHLVMNAIAGVLMPLTIEAGAQGYFLVVLSK